MDQGLKLEGQMSQHLKGEKTDIKFMTTFKVMVIKTKLQNMINDC